MCMRNKHGIAPGTGIPEVRHTVYVPRVQWGHHKMVGFIAAPKSANAPQEQYQGRRREARLLAPAPECWIRI